MFTTEGLALFALWEADPALKRKIKFMALGDLSPEQYADPDLYDGSESTLHVSIVCQCIKFLLTRC